MEVTQHRWALDAGQPCDFRDSDALRIDGPVEVESCLHDAAFGIRVALGAHFHPIGAGHWYFAYILNVILTVAPARCSVTKLAF